MALGRIEKIDWAKLIEQDERTRPMRERMISRIFWNIGPPQPMAPFSKSAQQGMEEILRKQAERNVLRPTPRLDTKDL